MSHIRPILDQQLEQLLEVAKEHAERIRVYKETYDGIIENVVRVAYEPPPLVVEPVDELTALQKTVTDAIMAMNLEDLTIVATTLGIINKGDAFLAATYCAATPSDPTSSGPTSSGPTSSGPTTSGPTSSGPTTSGPTTSGPTSSGPTTPGPTTSGPTTSGPTTPGRTTSGPTTPGRTTSGPTTPGPTTSGPTSSGPKSSAVTSPAATSSAVTSSAATSSAATSQKAPTPTAGSSPGSITVSPKPVTSNAGGISSGNRKRCSTSTSTALPKGPTMSPVVQTPATPTETARPTSSRKRSSTSTSSTQPAAPTTSSTAATQSSTPLADLQNAVTESIMSTSLAEFASEPGSSSSALAESIAKLELVSGQTRKYQIVVANSAENTKPHLKRVKSQLMEEAGPSRKSVDDDPEVEVAIPDAPQHVDRSTEEPTPSPPELSPQPGPSGEPFHPDDLLMRVFPKRTRSPSWMPAAERRFYLSNPDIEVKVTGMANTLEDLRTWSDQRVPLMKLNPAEPAAKPTSDVIDEESIEKLVDDVLRNVNEDNCETSVQILYETFNMADAPELCVAVESILSSACAKQHQCEMYAKVCRQIIRKGGDTAKRFEKQLRAILMTFFEMSHDFWQFVNEYDSMDSATNMDATGIVNFTAFLVKEWAVSPDVAEYCLDKLLFKMDKDGVVSYQTDENILANAINLMTVCGRQLGSFFVDRCMKVLNGVALTVSAKTRRKVALLIDLINRKWEAQVELQERTFEVNFPIFEINSSLSSFSAEVRGHLDKMTDRNCFQVAERMVKMSAMEEGKTNAVIATILMKAIDDPNRCDLIAKMSRACYVRDVKEIESRFEMSRNQERISSPLVELLVAKTMSGMQVFVSAMIRSNSITVKTTDPVKMAVAEKRLEIEQDRWFRYSLGTARLFGHLFLNQLFSANPVKDYIGILLKGCDRDSDNAAIVREEDNIYRVGVEILTIAAPQLEEGFVEIYVNKLKRVVDSVSDVTKLAILKLFTDREAANQPPPVKTPHNHKKHKNKGKKNNNKKKHRK